MNKIKYIGYYDIQENRNENRGYVFAATNKMDYIISVLNKIGYEVDIISASVTKNNRGYPGKTVNINDLNTLKLFRTLKRGNKINNALNYIMVKLLIILFLFKNTKKNDCIIVYHSLGYLNMIKFVKKIKKFKLILEVEEIYADVITSNKWRKREYNLFKYADAFILPTELLNEKINSENKPHIIIYGTYQVEYDRKCKFNDGKIHCVYAGTFDPRKGGANTSIDGAKFLDANYHVHIIGFGSEKDKSDLITKIDDISGKTKCKITYDGLFSGEDYIKFIQSCDIGLSTQNPDAGFNESSFPSKVLSYMANGLRVVSIKIKVLEYSDINNWIYYYEENTSEEIANAIKSIDFNDKYNSREMITKLNEKFKKNLKIMLNIMNLKENDL